MTEIPSQASELETALQQAVSQHRAGRLPEAEKLYRHILQFRPDHPDINNALGIALKGQGKSDEAAALFKRLTAVAPDYAPGHSNLGNTFFEQGKLAEAETSYRRALTLRPDMADALKNLGLVIVDSGRFAESVPLFRRHAELAYGGLASAAASEPTPPHKARHDQEQRDYRNGGHAAASTPFHLEQGDRVSGRAVNADASDGEIGAHWQNSRPQIAVIDNLLSDAALDRLRQYCWRSTVWRKPYANGYLGAMPEHGFACPLLVQIADELRSTYPAIVGGHPLLRWWGFKYDSQLTGINIHADFAAVNVNFWITPDEANLDPKSGGLVIWDKPAPLDWDFVQYNNPNAGQSIRDFLAKSGAKSVTVPYRANRAVIFDSDLFHETDRIVFKDGYLNRRINITMLYGRREAAAKPSAQPEH
jgi:Tfp pilus assembly protein PilF